jgi:hypothetical protein
VEPCWRGVCRNRLHSACGRQGTCADDVRCTRQHRTELLGGQNPASELTTIGTTSTVRWPLAKIDIRLGANR